MKSKNVMIGLVVAIVVVVTILVTQKLSTNDIKGNFSLENQGRGVNINSSPELPTDQRYQIWEKEGE